MMQVPFATTSYQSRSRPWSSQRLINWYPETAPTETKSKVILLPRPGLLTFGDIDATGGVRGMIEFVRSLYVVAGSGLYLVRSDRTVSKIGDIFSAGIVSMACSATQIAIVVGSGATYVYDVTTNMVTLVSDPDYPGATTVAFVGGYFAFSKIGDSGEFFLSDILDATSYEALNFATAEAAADPLVGVFENHGELWAAGTRTIQPFTNTGDVLFPFAPIPNATISRGLMARWSFVKIDNTVMWLGDDGIFYRASGYTPMRISTHAIEKKIEDTPSPSDVRAFAYTQEGHVFYEATSPSGHWTLVYDVATQSWHERETFGGTGGWRPHFCANAYNRNLVGDSQTGTIWQMDLDTYTDDGTLIRYEATSPPIEKDGKIININEFRIDFDAGQGLTSGAGANPQAMLQWSKDGGNTWSNEHWRPIGMKGEYSRRAIWRRLGQSRQWVFRVAITGPSAVRLLGADIELELRA